MKLFKVTYEQLSSSTIPFYKETKQSYYFCKSLDRLYSYMERELSVTILSIEIIPFTEVDSLNKNKLLESKYPITEQIIRAM